PAAGLSSVRLRRPRAALVPYTTLFRSMQAVDPLQTGTGSDDGVSSGAHEACNPAAVGGGGFEFVEQLQQIVVGGLTGLLEGASQDRKSTRLNSSHVKSSYAVFCLKKKS